MYPNTKIVFNICPNAMIGKLYIGESGRRLLNIESIEDIEEEIDTNYDAGRDFFEHITTGNVFKTGQKWFGLPGISDIMKEVNKHHPKPTRFTYSRPKMNVFKRDILVSVNK